MIERKFIAKGTRNSEIEEYLERELQSSDYSHSEIKRTPLSTRIVIYAGRPGMVIGRSGSKIKEITDTVSTKFGISNPQIEVKGVENPYLDAVVMAKQIAFALERGTNYRHVASIMLKNILEAGAIGVEICLAGKLSGARKRTEKFMLGHLKKSGDSRETCTQLGKATASLRPGMIGIKVRIMHSLPDVLLIEKRIKEATKPIEKKKEEKTEEKAEIPSAELKETPETVEEAEAEVKELEASGETEHTEQPSDKLPGETQEKPKKHKKTEKTSESSEVRKSKISEKKEAEAEEAKEKKSE